MTLDQCWALSETWYAGRLELDYEPPSLAEKQAVLERAGLAGAAWRLF